MVRVKTWVDAEVETEILFEDILSAFTEVIEESDVEHVKRLTETLGQITQILAAIPDEFIASIHPGARAAICDRLNRERARYENPGCGMAAPRGEG